MKNQDNSKLVLAFERLHGDYQYLDREHDALKEQVALKDAHIQYLENEYAACKDRLSKAEKMLWITQLNREQYKNENAALRRKLQEQQE